MDEDQKKCAGISCGSFMVFTISIAMVVIGCINVNLKEIDLSANLQDSKVSSEHCGIQPMIPFYLIVAGILNVALLVLRFVLERCCKHCCGGDATDSKFCATCGFLANFACINFFDIIALTLITIWLVIGTNWIFSVWDEVETDDPKKTHYCVHYLYYFSVAVAILSWMVIVCAIVCGLLAKACSCFWSLLCCKPCRQAEGEPV